VSADDYLLEHYAPRLSEKIRKARADGSGEVSGKFSEMIDGLQQAVERLRYDSRLALAQRDKWLDEIKSNLA
jgi:preprotein translocase subunit SecA